MSVITARPSITIEQFMAMPESRTHELIDGQLVEQKPMGAQSSLIASITASLLNDHVRTRKLGWVFGSDVVFQCFENPNTGKKPDVSFVRRGRFVGERVPLGHVKLAPDLAVEVVSPNDLAYEVTEKLEAYLSAGVRLIWVIYPNTRTVEVVRSDRSSSVLIETDELTGEGVIDGFRIRVVDLFPPLENIEPWPRSGGNIE